MNKIKKNDTVLVIAGKDRGKQGQVRSVIPTESRVVVTGVNMVKRHRRERAQNTPAGIIDKEAPMHVSKVMLICGSCKKPVRVGFRVRQQDGTKVRVCRSCGQDID